MSKFRDSASYCIVKATIKRSKLIHVDRRFVLECQTRNCLAKIAIVVHNLVNSETLPEQFGTMQRRARANIGRIRQSAASQGGIIATGGIGGLLHTECRDQLVKEDGYSVLEFRCGRCRGGSLTDLFPTPVDQFSPIVGKKFVEHPSIIRELLPLVCAATNMLLQRIRTSTRCRRLLRIGREALPAIPNFEYLCCPLLPFLLLLLATILFIVTS